MMRVSLLTRSSILLIIDQITKYYFFNKAIGDHYSLFESSMNTGISFSLPISYVIVIPLTLLSLFAFLYLHKKKELSDPVLVLLMTGTLGNLIDRVVYNGVRDFIVMFDWFIYNIADIYITFGVVMLFVSVLRTRKSRI